MSLKISLESILDKLGSDVLVLGSYFERINGVATLEEAETGDLSFFYEKKYLNLLKDTKASIVLVPKSLDFKPRNDQVFIYVEDPSLSLSLICRDIEISLFKKPQSGIHPSAIIHPSAKISKLAYVGPLCCIEEGAIVGDSVLLGNSFIGKNAKIGNDCIIFSNVSIGYNCIIGSGNRLSQGCVIGSDGFGYIQNDNVNIRIPQVGIVETSDDVDIGANSTIDRARIGKTFIGKGSKIDNLVQIAHNVKIGKNCLFISQSAVAGSTKIGDNVIIAGKSAISGHLEISNNVVVCAMSAVTSSIKTKGKVIGFPAEPYYKWWRVKSLNQKLPNLFKRFKELEKEIINN